MRFSEWNQKLEEQQVRLKNANAMASVSESISIGNRIYGVNLAKDKLSAEIDGRVGQTRFLRAEYTRNKEQFDAMLEAVTDQVDKIVKATDAILEAVSEDALPGAVIERMKGSQVSGEPSEMVEVMTEKKMESLLQTIRGRLVDTVFTTFDIDLPELAGQPISFFLNIGGSIQFSWGRIWKNSSGGQKIPDVEQAMFFLANFELIEKRVLEVVDQMAAIK